MRRNLFPNMFLICFSNLSALFLREINDQVLKENPWTTIFILLGFNLNSDQENLKILIFENFLLLLFMSAMLHSLT